MLSKTIVSIVNTRNNEIRRIQSTTSNVLNFLNDKEHEEINILLHKNKTNLEMVKVIGEVEFYFKCCNLHTYIEVCCSGKRNSYGNLKFYLKSNGTKENSGVSWVSHEYYWKYLKETATVGTFKKIHLKPVKQVFESFITEVYAKA